jgi:hypothetical protein
MRAPRFDSAREYVGLPVDSTIADARAAAGGLPVLPVHIRRNGAAVVAAEIVGSIDLDATRSLPSDALVRNHLGAVPALAGIGEPAVVVRERAANERSRIVVVVHHGVAVGTAITREISTGWDV